ncbi:winged helix-turn-helix transcriptional regulator [Chengkuizengella axinellae]|uniref:Helix-turn-helix domain-containing protein n=1 Tax=Chengkuizengella axinellae TaxID=3064388 RepID=A0ABT9IZ66_9BACL|nr:helix-turn-helix domain-containing protein [Chengkuizengella sp. 2205SS18-9]MDP5274617.1 helix-turn-helix domain-containing protein [Chengkuizengella sp. 2205SS18-9]
MSTKRKVYYCPVEFTLDQIAGKWKILIVLQLRFGAKRYTELIKKVRGITPKMLSQHLKDLEQQGIIHRQIFAEIPPKVEYSLTKEGEKLFPIIDSLAQWGSVNMEKEKGSEIV